MEKFLKKAKESSRIISQLDSKTKVSILNQMADALRQNSEVIQVQNRKDLSAANLNNLSDALKDRLFLDDSRIQSMAEAIEQIASHPEPLGKILDGWVTEDGLKIEKVSVPIGVIGIIYESRPNVTSDTAALCFKSGNVCVLKGGKEAQYSNKIIATILQDILVQNNLPKEIISLLPDSSREGVATLIKMDKYVDLIVPRGGEQLIEFISQNSSVPVIKHDKGQCHLFIHSDANMQKAIQIAINAKCQRPGVCNAIETLLIDHKIAQVALPAIADAFEEQHTKLKGCDQTARIIEVEPANDDDFHTEYLANILNIKVVDGIDGAIDHINTYGSGHSESIITQNISVSEKFLNSIDASSVYVNASTRFTDGGAFGFGAEVGISTNKLHARGPMGIEGLTTYKFKIYGDGQTR
jgi:glutamate-5-semialdehyde dehydrogenase